MTEAICYGLIWIAYSLLLFLHMTHLVHEVIGPPPPPPALSAPPVVAGSLPG